ncbi:MAG: zinc metallopeptidase [Planctomycetia bacterium]|nr:zinc metallopeptidase [Planctomycetia bacterium]
MLLYFMFIIPPMLLAFVAQGMVKYRYAKALKLPARMTGAAAARLILDSAGLRHIKIEQTPGKLSDHYSPREKIIRLSPEVYGGSTLASVGIAAHECGHAIQHATKYGPLVLTQFAWPMAAFGSNAAFIAIIAGLALNLLGLAYLGLALFGVVLVYQLVNLPVEFNASTRAKAQLVTLGVVPEQDMPAVRGVLWAAAMTYVAGMIAVLSQFLYYALIIMNSSRD